MKNKTIFTIVIFLIFSFSLVFPVNAFTSLVPIDGLEAHADNYQSLDFPTDSQLFYTNGTYWLIWSENNNFKSYGAYSNDEGATWSSKIQIRTVGAYGSYITGVAENDLYIHRRIGQYYSKARYLDNGTIIFESGITGTGQYMTQSTNDAYGGGGSVVDSNGYWSSLAFTSAGKDWTLIKNANNDGSWAMHGDYPMQDIYDDGEVYHTQISIDSDDNIYCLFANGTNFWLRTLISDVLGAEVEIADDIGSNGYFSATIDYADLLNIVYLDDENAFVYLTYNLTGSNFSSPVGLADGQSDSCPKLTYDNVTRDIYLIWFESKMFYMQYDYSQSSWLEEIQYTDTIATWISNERFVGFEQVSINELGVAVEHATLELAFIPFCLDPARTLEEPSEPSEPLTFEVDNTTIFIVVGIISFMAIGFMLVTAKKGNKI